MILTEIKHLNVRISEFEEPIFDNNILPVFITPLILKEVEARKKSKHKIETLNPEKKLTFRTVSFNEIVEELAARINKIALDLEPHYYIDPSHYNSLPYEVRAILNKNTLKDEKKEIAEASYRIALSTLRGKKHILYARCRVAKHRYIKGYKKLYRYKRSSIVYGSYPEAAQNRGANIKTILKKQNINKYRKLNFLPVTLRPANPTQTSSSLITQNFSVTNLNKVWDSVWGSVWDGITKKQRKWSWRTWKINKAAPKKLSKPYKILPNAAGLIQRLPYNYESSKPASDAKVAQQKKNSAAFLLPYAYAVKPKGTELLSPVATVTASVRPATAYASQTSDKGWLLHKKEDSQLLFSGWIPTSKGALMLLKDEGWDLDLLSNRNKASQRLRKIRPYNLRQLRRLRRLRRLRLMSMNLYLHRSNNEPKKKTFELAANSTKRLGFFAPSLVQIRRRQSDNLHSYSGILPADLESQGRNHSNINKIKSVVAAQQQQQQPETKLKKRLNNKYLIKRNDNKLKFIINWIGDNLSYSGPLQHYSNNINGYSQLSVGCGTSIAVEASAAQRLNKQNISEIFLVPTSKPIKLPTLEVLELPKLPLLNRKQEALAQADRFKAAKAKAKEKLKDYFAAKKNKHAWRSYLRQQNKGPIRSAQKTWKPKSNYFENREGGWSGTAAGVRGPHLRVTSSGGRGSEAVPQSRGFFAPFGTSATLSYLPHTHSVLRSQNRTVRVQSQNKSNASPAAGLPALQYQTSLLNAIKSKVKNWKKKKVLSTVLLQKTIQRYVKLQMRNSSLFSNTKLPIKTKQKAENFANNLYNLNSKKIKSLVRNRRSQSSRYGAKPKSWSKIAKLLNLALRASRVPEQTNKGEIWKTPLTTTNSRTSDLSVRLKRRELEEVSVVGDRVHVKGSTAQHPDGAVRQRARLLPKTRNSRRSTRLFWAIIKLYSSSFNPIFNSLNNKYLTLPNLPVLPSCEGKSQKPWVLKNSNAQIQILKNNSSYSNNNDALSPNVLTGKEYPSILRSAESSATLNGINGFPAVDGWISPIIAKRVVKPIKGGVMEPAHKIVKKSLETVSVAKKENTPTIAIETKTKATKSAKTECGAGAAHNFQAVAEPALLQHHQSKFTQIKNGAKGSGIRNSKVNSKVTLGPLPHISKSKANSVVQALSSNQRIAFSNLTDNNRFLFLYFIVPIFFATLKNIIAGTQPLRATQLSLSTNKLIENPTKGTKSLNFHQLRDAGTLLVPEQSTLKVRPWWVEKRAQKNLTNQRKQLRALIKLMLNSGSALLRRRQWVRRNRALPVVVVGPAPHSGTLSVRHGRKSPGLVSPGSLTSQRGVSPLVAKEGTTDLLKWSVSLIAQSLAPLKRKDEYYSLIFIKILKTRGFLDLNKKNKTKALQQLKRRKSKGLLLSKSKTGFGTQTINLKKNTKLTLNSKKSVLATSRRVGALRLRAQVKVRSKLGTAALIPSKRQELQGKNKTSLTKKSKVKPVATLHPTVAGNQHSRELDTNKIPLITFYPGGRYISDWKRITKVIWQEEYKFYSVYRKATKSLKITKISTKKNLKNRYTIITVLKLWNTINITSIKSVASLKLQVNFIKYACANESRSTPTKAYSLLAAKLLCRKHLGVDPVQLPLLQGKRSTALLQQKSEMRKPSATALTSTNKNKRRVGSKAEQKKDVSLCEAVLHQGGQPLKVYGRQRAKISAIKTLNLSLNKKRRTATVFVVPGLTGQVNFLENLKYLIIKLILSVLETMHSTNRARLLSIRLRSLMKPDMLNSMLYEGGGTHLHKKAEGLIAHIVKQLFSFTFYNNFTSWIKLIKFFKQREATNTTNLNENLTLLIKYIDSQVPLIFSIHRLDPFKKLGFLNKDISLPVTTYGSALSHLANLPAALLRRKQLSLGCALHSSATQEKNPSILRSAESTLCAAEEQPVSVPGKVVSEIAVQDNNPAGFPQEGGLTSQAIKFFNPIRSPEFTKNYNNLVNAKLTIIGKIRSIKLVELLDKIKEAQIRAEELAALKRVADITNLNLINKKKSRSLNSSKYLNKKHILLTNRIKILQTIETIKTDLIFEPKLDSNILSKAPVSLLYYSNLKPIVNPGSNTPLVVTSQSPELSLPPVLSSYIRELSIYNRESKGIIDYYSRIVSYNFNANNNKISSSITDLLEASFKAMHCLISKPVFVITPKKVTIELFYFLMVAKKSQLKKIRKRVKSRFNNKKERIYKIYKKKRLIEAKNLNLYKLNEVFAERFELLCGSLNKIFNKSIEFNLIRLHYPTEDSNILANFMDILINKVNLARIYKKLFKGSIIKSLITIKRRKYNDISIIPAFLTGLNIRIAGRIMTQRAKPRKTINLKHRGATARGKINYLNFARLTNKNKRGSYSITITAGQNYFK